MASLPCVPPHIEKLWRDTLAQHATILSWLTPLDATPYQMLETQFGRCKSWDTFLLVLDRLERVQTQEYKLLLPYAPDHEKYMSLLRHMQLEQEVVPRMLEGKSTLAEEIDFIREEASQHTDLIGQVLQELSDRALHLASELKGYDLPLLDLLYSSNQVALNSISPILKKLTLHELTESLLGMKRLLQLAEVGLLSLPVDRLERKINLLETLFFYYQRKETLFP